MSAPAATPSSVTPAPVAAPAEPSIADVLNAVTTLKAEVDGRFAKFGQDLGAVRSKVKAPAQPGPAADGNPAAPRSVSPEDLTAALALGEVRGKLPDAAKAKVQALLEGGRSYSDALAFAEALAETIATISPSGGATPPSAGQGVMPRPAPIGTSAMPAHNLATNYPKSVSELLRLKASNEAAYRAVMADPNFDSSELPQR